MLNSIWTKSLRDRRRSLIGWSVGLLLLAAMYLSLYPSISDNSALEEALKSYPDAVKTVFGIDDFLSPEGYLSSELFSFTMPIIVLSIAIGFASNATAGEEDRKTIDLLLAQPVTRSRVVWEKFGALCIALAVTMAVLFATLAIGAPLVDLHIAVDKLAAATVNQFLLGVEFGALTMAIAAWTGSHSISRAVAAALAVAAFTLNALAPLADWLEPYQKLSPIYHANGYEPLRTGFGLDHLAALVLVAAAFAVIAPRLFTRRDLAV